MSGNTLEDGIIYELHGKFGIASIKDTIIRKLFEIWT